MSQDVANAILNGNNNNRKKRQYALLLFNAKTAVQRDIKTVEKVFASALPGLTLLRLEDPDEGLKVMLLKNFEIIVIDSSFLGDDAQSVEYAAEAKKRKKCPIIFITHQENLLIKEYRSKLHLYEEMDDFMVSPVDFVDLSRRLKKFAQADARSAKRFLVEENVGIFRLNDDKYYQGFLSDISLVGFGIKLQSESLFRRGEQIQVKIPLGPFTIFHPHYGDILKLSGNVRRLSINGHYLGCSIEYITPMQSDCLVTLLEQIAARERQMRSNSGKKGLAEAV